MADRVFHPYPNAQDAFFNDNRPEVCELEKPRPTRGRRRWRSFVAS